MALKDILFQGVSVSYSGVFDFKGFYKVLKNWLKSNNYDFIEKDYKETQKNGHRLLMIKIIADKKLDDYIKKWIELTINTDLVRVEVKKGERKILMDQGRASLTFTAMLLKDYEDNYEKRPFATFIREVHDKFIDFSRIDKAKMDLRDDVYSIIAEFKNFFKS